MRLLSTLLGAVARRHCSSSSSSSSGAAAGAAIRFSAQHEWARPDAGPGDRGVYTVGVSAWAQEALGEVVFAQLPETGARVARGEACGALESVKAASEVYSPLAGVVVESNASVAAKPALVNEDCYGRGWLFRLRLDAPESFDAELMSQREYDEFLAKDQH